MSRLALMLCLMCSMTTALVNGRGEQRLLTPAKTGEGSAVCNLNSLPSQIQDRLKTDYASWKIQETKNLSDFTRKTWAGRKPPACPGIAEGAFQGAKAPTYALLLVPTDHPDAGYRLLVLSREAGQRSYKATVVEQSDDKGASNYFIRKVSVSQFFSEKSKRKFQVQAADCILMVDSAEQEYGTVIYFWSNGHYQNEPVDD